MIALALLAASIAGRHEFREIHMGVEVRIVLHADDTERAATAARAARTVRLDKGLVIDAPSHGVAA